MQTIRIALVVGLLGMGCAAHEPAELRELRDVKQAVLWHTAEREPKPGLRDCEPVEVQKIGSTLFYGEGWRLSAERVSALRAVLCRPGVVAPLPRGNRCAFLVEYCVSWSERGESHGLFFCSGCGAISSQGGGRVFQLAPQAATEVAEMLAEIAKRVPCNLHHYDGPLPDSVLRRPVGHKP